MAVSLRVTTLGGTLYTVEATEDWSVADVKADVHRLGAPDKTLQRLLHGDTELRNAQLVLAFARAGGSGADITLIARPPDTMEWLAKLRKKGASLRDAPGYVQADPELVRAAVEQDGTALQFACDSLRSCQEFVVTAVDQNAGALAFAAEELRTNREFVIEVVRRNGCALVGASERLRADPKVVLLAVSENHYALTHAADCLRNDLEFLLQLAKSKYVPPSKVKLFCRLKLRQNPTLLAALGEPLRSSRLQQSGRAALAL